MVSHPVSCGLRFACRLAFLRLPWAAQRFRCLSVWSSDPGGLSAASLPRRWNGRYTRLEHSCGTLVLCLSLSLSGCVVSELSSIGYSGAVNMNVFVWKRVLCTTNRFYFIHSFPFSFSHITHYAQCEEDLPGPPPPSPFLPPPKKCTNENWSCAWCLVMTISSVRCSCTLRPARVVEWCWKQFIRRSGITRILQQTAAAAALV